MADIDEHINKRYRPPFNVRRMPWASPLRGPHIWTDSKAFVRYLNKSYELLDVASYAADDSISNFPPISRLVYTTGSVPHGAVEHKKKVSALHCKVFIGYRKFDRRWVPLGAYVGSLNLIWTNSLDVMARAVDHKDLVNWFNELWASV